jgi:AcrR family transcriptional regulator
VSIEAAASRERILDEAARLFLASGYRGISMREIGEATGISKAGLYYHFKDKEDLLVAILVENLGQIGAIIEANRQPGTTARDQVGRIMQALFALAPEQRAIIRLASQEMMHLNPEARTAFNGLYQERFIGQLAGILAEGMASGELRPMEPQFATWILLGTLYPFFYSSHDRLEHQISSEMVATILDVYFNGIQVRT